jgi:VWFA-related protein
MGSEVKSMSTRFVRLVSIFCLPIFSGLAQQARVPDHQITLDVVVTDHSGKPVSGLQQQDFKLLDNKQPQNIVSFQAVSGKEAADTPVDVVLLSDEVNTAFERVSFERTQMQRYLQSAAELPRPVTLAFLSDAGLKIGSVNGDDGKALVAEMLRHPASLRSITKDQGFYGAADRIGVSLNALQQLVAYEAPRPGRKLVIWVSPGWAALTGPNEILSDKEQKDIFQQIVSINDALRRAQITLYNVDPLGTSDAGSFRTFYYQEFVKGVKKPSQVQIGNVELGAIAVQSGGRVLNSSNDIAGEIATCVGDANDYYTLTFDTVPGDRRDEYHALEVKLDKSGLKALTRNGYYTQP